MSPEIAAQIMAFAESVEGYSTAVTTLLETLSASLERMENATAALESRAVSRDELRRELATVHAELAELRDALQIGDR